MGDNNQIPDKEVKRSDFQIAWELSKTSDKPFFIDSFRKLLNQFDREEISMSKVVEELNVAAHKWRYHQSPDEKDLIIHGVEEGAEAWKSEYDNCRAVLQELVQLKEIKEKIESEEPSQENLSPNQDYLKRKPLAWNRAKDFLKQYQHGYE